MSDLEILSDIEALRKICREDAQRQNFKRTDGAISHFRGLVSTTNESQLRHFYQTTVKMMVNYRERVIGIYAELRRELSSIGPNKMPDESMLKIQELISSLHFNAYPTDV